MGRFTVIPQDAFDGLQMDAGVLLKTFDPANPTVTDEALICATTGGINPSCVPTYSDFGEDVDNVPNNMREFKHLDGWECKISTSSLGTTPQAIKLALGCADIDGTNTSKIVPRNTLKQSDFTDIWWVGDRADGGFVAIQLKNALSTGGFSLQTTKNGKGTIGLEITGHVSINAQNEVPMVFYSVDPEEPVVVPEVILNHSHLALEVDEKATLTATTKPSGKTVTWTTSDSSTATVANGEVTAKGAGSATITATITVDGTNYTDTCVVTVTASEGA